MPSMADITVKNVANADVVYVAKTPSAGDKSPAVWTQDAASPIIGFRPKLQVQTRNNGSNNGRIVEGTFSLIATDNSSGVELKTATIPIEFRVVIPTNVDYTFAREATHQWGNLMVSTLLRQVFDSGYAPT